MIIKMFCNDVYPIWSPNDDFLRGTEEWIREFSNQAILDNNEVIVYYNGISCCYNGVYYLPKKQFTSDCDLLILVKCFADTYKSKRVIYWTNNIDDKNKLINHKFDKVIAISNYHKDNLLKGINRVQVVYHGIYKDRYKSYKKQENLCIYASSPDRGLYELEKMWSEIKKQVPNAVLKVTYNGISEGKMDSLYRRADFLLYPCSGIELFCITGYKAQCSGVIPIIYPYMALSETIKHGIFTNRNNFVKDTVKVMKDNQLKLEIRNKLINEKYQTHRENYLQIIK